MRIFVGTSHDRNGVEAFNLELKQYLKLNLSTWTPLPRTVLTLCDAAMTGQTMIGPTFLSIPFAVACFPPASHPPRSLTAPCLLPQDLEKHALLDHEDECAPSASPHKPCPAPPVTEGPPSSLPTRHPAPLAPTPPIDTPLLAGPRVGRLPPSPHPLHPLVEHPSQYLRDVHRYGVPALALAVTLVGWRIWPQARAHALPPRPAARAAGDPPPLTLCTRSARTHARTRANTGTRALAHARTHALTSRPGCFRSAQKNTPAPRAHAPRPGCCRSMALVMMMMMMMMLMTMMTTTTQR
jgi:hypothetical protein